MNFSKHPGAKSLDTPLNTAPHYTDKRYQYGLTEFCLYPEELVDYGKYNLIEGLKYEYSDRLYEQNREKVRLAIEHTNLTLKVSPNDWQTKSTARYHQEILRFLFDDPNLQLIHLIAGYNWDNGYPYLVYGFLTGGSNG